jgi:hypothetical protein
MLLGYGHSENFKKRILALSYLFVRPSSYNSAPNGWIFMKFDIGVFFENMSRKIEVWLKYDNNNG